MRRLAIVTCFAVLLCGCASKPKAVHSPRLTEARVLELADDFAKQKREQHESFELQFYPDRNADFDPKHDVWWIHYSRKPNRYRGDHFEIKVDDTTEAMKYFGGR